jgi:hypothetical protein
MIACAAQWTNPVLFAVKTFDDEALYVTRMQTADGGRAAPRGTAAARI